MIAAVLFVAFLLFLISVLICLPRSAKVELSAFPSPAWIYLQIVLSLFYKKLAVRKSGPKIEVSLTKPVQFSPSRFQGFLALAGFGECGTGGATPASYPLVEAFRLTMQALAHPQFPFPILGSVLSKNRSVLFRPVEVDERLVFSCTVSPNYRVTEKGHVEVDIVTVAKSLRALSSSAASRGHGSGSTDSIVWKNTLTVVILTKRMKKREEGAPATTPAESSTFTLLSTWRLAADVGRRYGKLSGDLNPIHLSAATARPFGFQRPIAHALFLVAKSEAALRSAGLAVSYPLVLDTEFKRPTLLPATLQMGTVGGRAFSGKDLSSARLSEEGVRFAVRSEATPKVPAKDVLVGRIFKSNDAA